MADLSIDAISAGNSILNRFVSTRAKERSVDSSRSSMDGDMNGNGYYEAVVDGGHLGGVFSAQKRGLQNRSNLANMSTSNIFFGTPDERSVFYSARKPSTVAPLANELSEPESLEMIRVAISKVLALSGKEGHSIEEGENESTDDPAPEFQSSGKNAGLLRDLLTMLQGVEEQLEGVAGVGLDIAAKRNLMIGGNLSPVDKENSFPNTPMVKGGGTRDSAATTPTAGATPKKEELLKIYMDNQLELNQEELQHYEKLANDLVERLEAAQTQITAKDQAISTLEAAQEAQTLQLDELSRQLTAQTMSSRDLQESSEVLQKQVQELTEQLETTLQTRPDVQLLERMRVAAAASASLASVETTSEATGEAAKQEKSKALLRVYMDNQLALDVNELKYYEDVANDLMERLHESEEAAESEKIALTAQLAQLSKELNESQAENENVQETLDDVRQELVDARSRLEAAVGGKDSLEGALEEALRRSNAFQSDLKHAQAELLASAAGLQEAKDAQNETLFSLDEVQAQVLTMQHAKIELESELQQARADAVRLNTELSNAEERLQLATGGQDATQNALAESQHAHAEAQRSLSALQEVLEQLREKDAMNEEMIQEMQEMQEEGEEQITHLRSQLQTSAIRATEAHEKAKTLETELQAAREAAVTDSSKRSELEAEVQNVKNQLETIASTLNEDVTVLTERIDRLKRDKDEAQQVIKQQKAGLLEKDSELAVLTQQIIAGEAALQQAQECAEAETHQREQLWRELQTVIRSTHSAPSLGIENESHSEAAEEDSYRLNNPFTSAVDMEDEDALTLASSQQGGDDFPFGDEGVSGADFAELAHRLDDAERRAAEASASGADKVASSLRQAAIADAECSRLKALGDHFKQTNNKLLEENKVARKQAVRVRGLEAQVTDLQKQAREALAQHEAAVRKVQGQTQEQFERFERERESLLEMHAAAEKAHAEARTQAEAHAAEVSRIASLHRNALDDVSSQDRQIEVLNGELGELRDEIQRHTQEIATLTAAVDMKSQELQAQEVVLHSWKAEKDNLHLDWHAKHSDLQEEYSALEGTHLETASLLEAMRLQVSQLEEASEQIKFEHADEARQLVEARSRALELQMTKEELQVQLTTADEELSKRYSSIQRFSDEADAWQSKAEEAAAEVVAVREVVTAAEAAAAAAREETLKLQRDLHARSDEVLEAQKHTGESEARLRVLEAELQRVHTEELAKLQNAHLHAEKVSREASASYSELRDQYDALTGENERLEAELATARSGEQSQAALVTTSEHRAAQLQNDLTTAREKHASVRKADVEISLRLHGLVVALQESMSTYSLQHLADEGGDLSAIADRSMNNSQLNSSMLERTMTSEDIAATAPLPAVNEQVEAIEAQTHGVVGLLSGYAEALEALQRRTDADKLSMDGQASQLQALLAIRDGQALRVSALEEEVTKLQAQSEAQRREAIQTAKTAEEGISRTRTALRGLTGILSDAAVQVQRATGMSAVTGTAEALAAAEAATEEVAAAQDAPTGARLNAVTLEMERAMSALVDVLERASTAAAAKEKTLNMQQASLNEALASQQLPLPSEPSGEEEVNVEQLSYEHAQLRTLVRELGRQKAELEAEGRATLSINADLRGSLEDAERLCEDFKTRYRAVQLENDVLAVEVRGLAGHQSSDAQATVDSELEMERSKAEVARLKADNEVMLQLQQSLETELERLREGPNMTTDGGLAQGASQVSIFDAERLLGALYSGVDQLVAGSLTDGRDSAITASSSANRLHELHSVALASSGTNPLSDRFDAAIHYLAELRVWTREEVRAKRALAAKAESAERDAAAAQVAAADASHTVESVRTHKARQDAEQRALRKEAQDAHRALTAAQEQLQRATQDSARHQRAAEDERAKTRRQGADLQTREGELGRLRNELEAQRTKAAKAASQLASNKENAETWQSKAEKFGRENRELQSKLEVLSREASTAVAATAAAADVAAGRTVATGGAELAALRARTEELQAALTAAREEARAHREHRTRHDTSFAGLQREMHAAQRKSELAEARCDTLTNEKYLLHDEKGALQAALAEAQQQTALERAKVVRAEERERAAAMGSPTAAEPPRSKHAADAQNAVVASLQSRLERADTTRRTLETDRADLHSQLAQLRAQHEHQHAEMLQLRNAHQLMEAEYSKSHARAERLQSQLVGGKDTAAANKTETRRVRRLVLEAASQMREATNVVRAEASQSGMSLPVSPDPRAQGGSDGESDLSGALGLPELTSGLAALRETLVWMRHAPQQRAALEGEKRSLEAQLVSLRADHADFRKRGEAEITAAAAEVQAQTARAEDTKKQLRAAQQAERELRAQLEEGAAGSNARVAAAEAECGRMRAQLDLSQATAAGRPTSAAAEATTGLQVALQELRAVEHHRGVLRDTVTRLEAQLKLTADSAVHSFTAVLEGIAASDESAVRQAARYHARCTAYEEVASMYRSAIQALYADGTGYSTAQFEALQSPTVDPDTAAKAQGWMELEVSAVRRSYEAELRLADSECADLRGRLRQTESFSAELSRRFEETLQAQYSGKQSKSSPSEARQFLESAMSSQVEQITELRKALAEEKERCRRRHRHIVDALTRASHDKDNALARSNYFELACEQAGVAVRAPAGLVFAASSEESTPFKYTPAGKRAGTSYSATPGSVAQQYSNGNYSSHVPVRASPLAGAPYVPSPEVLLAQERMAPAATSSSHLSSSTYRLATSDNHGSAALRVRRAGGLRAHR